MIDEASDVDWSDVEAGLILDEYEGASPDRLASELERAAGNYDGGEHEARQIAAALRQRTLAWTGAKRAKSAVLSPKPPPPEKRKVKAAPAKPAAAPSAATGRLDL